MHKVHKIYTTKLTIPSEKEAETKGESSNEYKLWEGNIKAYDLLVHSCTGVLLGLIEAVVDGDAHEAWNKLLAKYETKKEDIQSLEEEWNACKLDNLSTNLMEWFLKLNCINRMFSIDIKYGKDNVQIAGHILNNVCKEYSNMVTSIEASGKTKDVEGVQEAIGKHWNKQKSSGKDSRNMGKTCMT